MLQPVDLQDAALQLLLRDLPLSERCGESYGWFTQAGLAQVQAAAAVRFAQLVAGGGPGAAGAEEGGPAEEGGRGAQGQGQGQVGGGAGEGEKADGRMDLDPDPGSSGGGIGLESGSSIRPMHIHAALASTHTAASAPPLPARAAVSEVAPTADQHTGISGGTAPLAGSSTAPGPASLSSAAPGPSSLSVVQLLPEPYLQALAEQLTTGVQVSGEGRLEGEGRGGGGLGRSACRAALQWLNGVSSLHSTFHQWFDT